MLNRIKNKIIDLQVKMSTPELEVTRIAEEDNNNFNFLSERLVKPDGTVSSRLQGVNFLANEFNTLLNEYNQIEMNFYNTREAQYQSYQDRIEILKLRQKILYSIDQGLKTAPIVGNDKRMFQPGKHYGIDESGIWLPYVSNKGIMPTKVEITNDSNIIIGTLLNRFVNSKAEALWTISQNDIFSVHREDMSNLMLNFILEIPNRSIINEIELLYIKKEGQVLECEVIDYTTQEIIFSGIVKDFWLSLKRPIYGKKIAINIKASPIKHNQLDIKNLTLCQRKYTDTLEVETIGMPMFAGKYLTLENVTYATPEHSNFFDVEVRANGEKLNSFSKGEKVSGPYKDPIFTINAKLKNIEMLYDYLSLSTYTTSLVKLNNRKIYGIGKEIVKGKRFTVMNIAEGGKDIYLNIPISGLEDVIAIKVNGILYKRIEGEEIVDPDIKEKTYTIEYLGEGYNVKFDTLLLNSSITCEVETIPMWYEEGGIYVPHNGLGTSIELEYAKEMVMKKVSPFPDGNGAIFLNQKNIQKIVFRKNSEEVSLTEKPINSLLGNNEYTLDRQTGILKVKTNQVFSFDEIVVFAFDTGIINGITARTDKKILANDSMQIFTISNNLQDLILGKQLIYTLVPFVNNAIRLSGDKRCIQLPKNICLHKGSITVGNKKEVVYIDGEKELFENQSGFEFFDLIETNTTTGVLKFEKRNSNLNLLEFLQKNLTIESILFSKKIKNPDSEYGNSASLASEGDYCFTEEGYLFIKTISQDISSVKVKGDNIINSNLFSVDYKTNRIFTKIGPTLLAFLIGSILGVYPQENPVVSFKYTPIKALDFNITIDLPARETLQENEHYIYRDVDFNKLDLVSYFTPVIEKIDIGIIG
jgi:hypothetical protein